MRLCSFGIMPSTRLSNQFIKRRSPPVKFIREGAIIIIDTTPPFLRPDSCCWWTYAASRLQTGHSVMESPAFMHCDVVVAHATIRMIDAWEQQRLRLKHVGVTAEDGRRRETGRDDVAVFGLTLAPPGATIPEREAKLCTPFFRARKPLPLIIKCICLYYL